MSGTPDILRKIVEYKRHELASAKSHSSKAELKARCGDMPPVRGFRESLERVDGAGRTALIAEVKKGSPSKGVICADFDPVAIAGIYERNGAACLSVLTDEHFFLGHLDYLTRIRTAVNIPLLRKDFIFDEYQIWEARAAGADAVLLIAAMLGLPQMLEFIAVARELSLDILLEVHDEAELEKALETDCRLVGINNRNLRTFELDLATTERLCALMPPGRFPVAESGVHTRDDVLRLHAAGARAFLIGESLMREPDIGTKVLEILGEK
ncbi:MAG: indole-3-glycerol phosphate synthase TrpC [Geobacteraceae bacterium]|nr:indole-3-glycerol phosphate synthase TrpC [Geobacteraceae bacterium]